MGGGTGSERGTWYTFAPAEYYGNLKPVFIIFERQTSLEKPKLAADSASCLADSARAAMATAFDLSNWSGLRRTFTFTY